MDTGERNCVISQLSVEPQLQITAVHEQSRRTAAVGERPGDDGLLDPSVAPTT